MNTQFNLATKHYNITKKNSKMKLKTGSLLAVKSSIGAIGTLGIHTSVRG